MPDSGRVTEPGFRIDRELNALQNGCIADLQGQFTDEGRNTCRVAGDRYRGIICLTGAGEMGEDHKDGADGQLREQTCQRGVLYRTFLEELARAFQRRPMLESMHKSATRQM